MEDAIDRRSVLNGSFARDLPARVAVAGEAREVAGAGSKGEAPASGPPASLPSEGILHLHSTGSLPFIASIWLAPEHTFPPLSDRSIALGFRGTAFLEHAPCDCHGRIRRRPACIEGKLRDQLDQFIPADAVVERSLQVKGGLVGAVERD